MRWFCDCKRNDTEQPKNLKPRLSILFAHTEIYASALALRSLWNFSYLFL